MLNVVRSVRAKTPSSFSSSLPNQITGKTPTGVRFAQSVSAGSNQPDSSNKMDQKQESVSQSGDMSSSFGEAYATRSDDEGFGGIYGGNQNLSKEDEHKIVHGNAPEYDESQGSEVKEKEKARNQKKSAT
ncbi:hypothetical protein ACJIZ3_014477 [Penstemon smallii]|uniref:Uncharacterized protein n=1 Tax=Penstemon smallii TaxID=265156 RepID=A0ABD3RKG9_9LAMI